MTGRWNMLCDASLVKWAGIVVCGAAIYVLRDSGISTLARPREEISTRRIPLERRIQEENDTSLSDDYYTMVTTHKVAPHDETCQAYVDNLITRRNITDETRDYYQECFQLNNALTDTNECGNRIGDPSCCKKIERYVLKYCQEDAIPSNDTSSSRMSTADLLIGIIVLLLLCTATKVFKDYFLQWGWLPDACAYILVTCLVSMMMGMMAKVASDGSKLKQAPEAMYSRLHFDDDLFLQILLPPIIFESALSVDKKSFVRDICPILLFAGVGTLLSSISIGFMTNSWSGGYIPLLDSLVFGALISSIDPVATLGILTGVGVEQTGTLFTLVFGESLLNDGVAIVLFETLVEHLGDDHALEDPQTYKDIAVQFIVVSVGSMATAIVFGAAAIVFYWSMQHNGSDNGWIGASLQRRLVTVAEVATFFGWSLIPYYVAEVMGFSGIIAIMTSGFIMDAYLIGDGTSDHNGDVQRQPEQTRRITLKEAFTGRHPGQSLISPQSSENVEFIAEMAAWTTETLIFAYLGMFLFDDKIYSFILESVAVSNCILSRAGIVISLCWLVNLAVRWDLEGRIRRCLCCTREAEESSNAINDANTVGSLLDRKTQVILFLAGIRGAVSYALVSKLPVYDVATQHGTRYKAELKAMTSTVIIFTLFAFGIVCYYTVNCGVDGDATVESRNDETKSLKPTDGHDTSRSYGGTSNSIAV